MSRWFEIKGHYYNLNSFTHFEARKQVFRNTETWDIVGHHAFPVTWKDEADPNIKTQSYVAVGGFKNEYATQAEAELDIQAILRGDYDVEVRRPEIKSEIAGEIGVVNL